MTGDNVDGSTNILPKMNIDTLRDGYQSIMEHIYSPEHYYKRVKTFLREYKVPKIRVPLDRATISTNLSALFRSHIRLGLLGRNRALYWNLLFWTFFTKPRLLPDAITFAIYGYHFREVYETRVLSEQ